MIRMMSIYTASQGVSIVHKVLFLVFLLGGGHLRRLVFSQTDIECLQEFKASVNDPTGSLSSWNITPRVNICTLNGVKCLHNPNNSDANPPGHDSPDYTGSNVYMLQVSAFSLSGSFPRGLEKCKYLTEIDFSFNEFSGHISPTLCTDAPFLTTINLMGNNFSGSIPQTFGKCAYLKALSLQKNNLCGPVPVKSINNVSLPSLTVFDYYDNSKLGTSCSTERSSRACKGFLCEKVWVSVLCFVVSTFALALGLLCWRLFFVRHSVSSVDKDGHPQMMMTFSHILNVTHTDLLETINQKDNVIGLGARSTVYKGTLPGGEMFAAKVMLLGKRDEDARKAEIDFLQEVRHMAKLRHRNIVKVLGYCSTVDIKALIMEFMPQGNLRMHLYGNAVCKLTWEARFKIAMGVAEGMVYLHHYFHEPIIHCDLKPDNILLDADLEPKVADFGASKSINRDGEHACTSPLIGTLGYIPPEYGTGSRVSTKGDVYSFGVVLLELLTRKQPVGASDFGESGCLVGWALEYFKDLEDPLKLLDPSLTNPKYMTSSQKDQMKLLLQVGVLCTRTDPQTRPDLREVLSMLKQI